MSDPVLSRRCTCGHLESEHTIQVRPSDNYRHCSGVVFAVDQFDPDDRCQREVMCCCTSFVEADRNDFEIWGERAAV